MTRLRVCDHERRIMLVADHLSSDEMFGVLCHEFWQAFQRDFADQVKSLYSDADLFAIGTRQFVKSLGAMDVSRLNDRLAYRNEALSFASQSPAIAAFYRTRGDVGGPTLRLASP